MDIALYTARLCGTPAPTYGTLLCCGQMGGGGGGRWRCCAAARISPAYYTTASGSATYSFAQHAGATFVPAFTFSILADILTHGGRAPRYSTRPVITFHRWMRWDGCLSHLCAVPPELCLPVDLCHLSGERLSVTCLQHALRANCLPAAACLS